MYDLCLHRSQPPRFDFQSVHFGSNAFENTYYGASLYSDAYIYGVRSPVLVPWLGSCRTVLRNGMRDRGPI